LVIAEKVASMTFSMVARPTMGKASAMSSRRLTMLYFSPAVAAGAALAGALVGTALRGAALLVGAVFFTGGFVAISPSPKKLKSISIRKIPNDRYFTCIH
jgi:hypothetical protein